MWVSSWGALGFSTSGTYLCPTILGVRFDDLDGAIDLSALWDGDPIAKGRAEEIDAGHHRLAPDGFRWRTRLLDWITLLHGQLANTVLVHHALIWIDDPMGTTYSPADKYEPAKLVSLDTWRHAIYHASLGHDVPLAGALLIRALKSYCEWDDRHAVIDAATACELALDARLRHVSLDKPLPERAGLGTYVNAARKAGLALPSKLETDVLIRARNASVHRGDKLQREQTRVALSAAGRIVSEHALIIDCRDDSLPEAVYLGHGHAR
jgi:hypothetical protein